MNRNSNGLPAGVLLTVLTVTVLPACSGSPSVRLDDASLSGDPSAMWEDGRRAADNGEALIARGERRLSEGRQQVRDGEQKITDGNQRVVRARQEYQEAVGAGDDLPAATAGQLQAIGRRWAAAIESIKQGNALLARGNKNIERAHAEIREGRQQMEIGSVMMRNSQRSRMGRSLLPPPG